MRNLLKSGLNKCGLFSIAALLAGCVSNVPAPRTANTANYAVLSEKYDHLGKVVISSLKLQSNYDINIDEVDGVKLPPNWTTAHLISPGKHAVDITCVELDADPDPDDTYIPTYNRTLIFTAVANKKYQLDYNFPYKSHYKYYDLSLIHI